MKYWQKFYSCDCGVEGIMLSDEYFQDDIPLIDIGYWMHAPQHSDYTLGWKQRISWCWRILKTGQTFNDMVILDKKTALELGKDLVKWGKKNVKSR